MEQEQITLLEHLSSRQFLCGVHVDQSLVFCVMFECTLFCNLQSWVRTNAVLVVGLYELLGNPTTGT
jgi:hypothetical protein